MAAISVVYSLRYAAEVLGEDEEFLGSIAFGMTPERGRITVVLWPGTEQDEHTTTAFTEEGLDELRFLVQEYKRSPWPI